jgi:hypothetical protein
VSTPSQPCLPHLLCNIPWCLWPALLHLFLSHVNTSSALLSSPSLQCLAPHIFWSLHCFTCIGLYLYLLRETSSGSSANPELFSDLPTTLETCSDISNQSSKVNTEKRRSSRRKAPHSIFKFQLLPGKYIKIAFDRLALLALFDRYLCLFIYLYNIEVQ